MVVISGFVEKMMMAEGGVVRFIRALEQGRPCWYFLRLSPQHYNHYKQALKQSNMDIADYGEIIHAGWGDSPSEITKTIMRKRYGVIFE